MHTAGQDSGARSREQTQMEFEHILKNDPVLYTYRWASRYLEQDELPAMWLHAHVSRVFPAYVLLTDKRVLLIKLGPTAESTMLVQGFLLGDGTRGSVRKTDSKYAGLDISFSAEEALVVAKVPIGLAEEFAAFLALPAEEKKRRAMAILTGSIILPPRVISPVSDTRTREQIRHEFDHLLKDDTTFAEYWATTNVLQSHEVPHMCLWADVSGSGRPTVLVTDRRVLLFRRGLRAASARLLKEFQPTDATSVSVTERGRQYADIDIRFGPSEALRATKVPRQLAEHLRTFLTSSQVDRTALATARLQPPRPEPVAGLGSESWSTPTSTDATAAPPTEVSGTAVPDQIAPIFGKTGCLEVHDDFVRLDHRTFGPYVIESVVPPGLKGTVADIPFDSIVAIQVEQSRYAVGFIHFVVGGDSRLLITLKEAWGDKNSLVMLHGKEQDEEMLRVKAHIEAIQRRAAERSRAEEPQRPYLSEISQLAYDTAKGQNSIETLTAKVPDLVRDGGVSPAQLEKAVFEAFDRAVSEYLEDGLLSTEEEAKLDHLVDALPTLGVPFELAKCRSMVELVKATALRQLMEGTTPETKHYFSDWPLPFVFMKSEQLIWAFVGVSYYADTVRRQYVGRSIGGSVRVAKGLYFRTSSFRGNPVDITQRELIDQGFFAVTDKHLYFSGSAKSFRIRHDKLVAIHPYENGVGVERDTAAAKPEVFLTGDGWFTYNLLKNVTLLDKGRA